ncbi:hypothetical protein LPJ70_006965, partial [Coemansia sp. RSA 2708]
RVADARSAFWDAQTAKSQLSNEVSNLRELLEEKDLGPHDMYLSLKNECYSLDSGEYTYEVCLLDRAAQIENRNGARQNLGSFTGFGENGVHTVLQYRHGAKCWNGPERSMTVEFECAEEIKLLSVKEPEKCEYHAVMSGPFACALPASEPESAREPESAAEPEHVHIHDEL